MQILGPKRLNRALGRNLVDKGGATDLFSSAPLDLRFAQLKTLDPRITFTRASTGTYVGSDGLVKTAVANEARFDHNPTTGESLGLLVEEARTNLSLRSQELDNAAWTKAASSITANAIASPDGTTTADKLVEDSSTAVHNIIEATAITYTSGVAYSFSFFIKKAERQTVQILTHPNPFPGTLAQRTAIFNSNTGGFVSVGSAYTGSSVTVFSDGWYRVSVSSTSDATATGNFTISLCSDDAGTTSYAGDGTSGLYLWGAQLEAGAFPTSYIPTTTATATRAADVASITGTAFSSFYNQTEGTVFAKYAERAFSVTHQVATVSNGTANERISLAINTSNILDVGVISGGTDTFGGNTPTLTAQEYQIGFGYKADDSGVSANGSAITVDSAVTLPAVSQLDIGARAGSSQILNSTIKRLTYWPTRLANPTLQSITTP